MRQQSEIEKPKTRGKRSLGIEKKYTKLFVCHTRPCDRLQQKKSLMKPFAETEDKKD
jgi:hypothetical protein